MSSLHIHWVQWEHPFYNNFFLIPHQSKETLKSFHVSQNQTRYAILKILYIYIQYQDIHTEHITTLPSTLPDKAKKCLSNCNSLQRIRLPLQSIRFARYLPPFLCTRLGYAAPSWETPHTPHHTPSPQAAHNATRLAVARFALSFF